MHKLLLYAFVTKRENKVLFAVFSNFYRTISTCHSCGNCEINSLAAESDRYPCCVVAQFQAAVPVNEAKRTGDEKKNTKAYF